MGTLAYIVSFALGAGPVPGLLVPEITPLRLRGAGRTSTQRTSPLRADGDGAAHCRPCSPHEAHVARQWSILLARSIHGAHAGAPPLQRSRAGGCCPRRGRSAGRAVSASLATHWVANLAIGVG